jgi:general stress protein YciG
MADKDTSNRGFARMNGDKQREIASKGGRAAHEKGTAHEFTSEEAREAGRKGGERSHASRSGSHQSGAGMSEHNRSGSNQTGAGMSEHRVNRDDRSQPHSEQQSHGSSQPHSEEKRQSDKNG